MDELGDGRASVAHRTGNILHGPKREFKLDKGIGWYIWDACDEFHDNVCQIQAETGESEKYSSFKNRAIILATHMKRLGIKKGDVVMTCATNNLDSAVPTTSALFLGAISSSLDPTLSARECKHLISLVEPKIIFTIKQSVGSIEEALVGVGSCKPLIVVYGSCDGYRSFDEFMLESGDEDGFEPEVLDRDDMSFVFFSSGTTGMPKGICLSNRSIYNESLVMLIYLDYAKVVTHFTSFYWISAVMLYIFQFKNGGARILVNAFEGEKTMEYFAKYKVEATFMSTLFSYKVTSIDNIERFDLSSLKCIMFGGSALSAEQLTRIRKLLPQTFCSLGYGMTELAGPAAVFPSSKRELAYANPKACGQPSIGITIKIADTETDESLGPNQSGEIRIKCDSMMLGYYNQDASTQFDAEGYLKTGDIGHFDENCCVYVSDRIKDMFKYQSWHIVPAVIESVILEHPDVAEAVVVGVPHEEDGHVPAAVVKLHPSSRATAGDIGEFVAERVLDRQRLRAGVFIVEEIPKTPSHKVLRRKVQEIVLQCLKSL